MSRCRRALLLVLAITCVASLEAAGADTKSSPLVVLNDAATQKLITGSSKQVSWAKSGSGLEVMTVAGEDGYPGITITPAAPWNLSAHGHVTAHVTNTGSAPLGLNLRVDNEGNWQDNPFNAENVFLDPGRSGEVTVIFGHSYGHKPSFKLNPASVVRVLLFTGKVATGTQKFRIDSIEAGGPAGETPAAAPVSKDDIRLAPKAGLLFGEGADVKSQWESSGATTSSVGPAEKIEFAAGAVEGSASLKPAEGRWDLRQRLEVVVSLKNTGTQAIAPRLRMESNGGPTDWVASAPVAAGKTAEIVLPFISEKVWDGTPESGNRFTSDAASRLVVSVEHPAAAASVIVESVVARMPKVAVPDWLGKRPPIEGKWTKTFDEEFDGSSLDASKWSVVGENYYDQVSHFSKENVVVQNGYAHLRFEKKSGFPNDDPNRKTKTPYATGYLDTYSRFAQRYGYFEAKMKLPAAPGLWPAFWMMPDRGAGGDRGFRQDTGNGGMEFDIMEYLSRWGPGRYNIAMHWDGYGKEHKSTGSDRIYFAPDKDGFITAGLLWEPGSLQYFANGKLVMKWQNSRVPSVSAGIMFTFPMGGWDNDPLDEKQLPAEFLIDYVRAWQRADLQTAK